MAKKKYNFKQMEETELKRELAVWRENLRVLHFKAEGSKSKNVKESMTTRKKIARILTELNHARGRASSKK